MIMKTQRIQRAMCSALHHIKKSMRTNTGCFEKLKCTTLVHLRFNMYFLAMSCSLRPCFTSVILKHFHFNVPYQFTSHPNLHLHFNFNAVWLVYSPSPLC